MNPLSIAILVIVIIVVAIAVISMIKKPPKSCGGICTHCSHKGCNKKSDE